MLNIVVGEGETHQYAHGITAGEVIRNVHGENRVQWLHLLTALNEI